MSTDQTRVLWERWQALSRSVADLGGIVQNPVADTCPDKATLQAWLNEVAAARRHLDQLLKDTIRHVAANIETGG